MGHRIRGRVFLRGMTDTAYARHKDHAHGRKGCHVLRIVPGTGEWKINGRTLEGYFPNKVHQQIVNEPLKVLELDGAYDVLRDTASVLKLDLAKMK